MTFQGTYSTFVSSPSQFRQWRMRLFAIDAIARRPDHEPLVVVTDTLDGVPPVEDPL